jgi:hypothetical protein
LLAHVWLVVAAVVAVVVVWQWWRWWRWLAVVGGGWRWLAVVGGGWWGVREGRPGRTHGGVVPVGGRRECGGPSHGGARGGGGGAGAFRGGGFGVVHWGVLLGSTLGRWVPASVHRRGCRTCDCFCCTKAVNMSAWVLDVWQVVVAVVGGGWRWLVVVADVVIVRFVFAEGSAWSPC